MKIKKLFLVLGISHLVVIGAPAQRIMTLQECVQEARVNNVSAKDARNDLLIAKVTVSGRDFSDGEQHYLPILPDRERVTVTVPFTQNEPGTKTINLTSLIPAAANSQLTVEYTNNPAWLMVQALPLMSSAKDENVISQASALYANRLGSYILSQSEAMKETIDVWSKEEGN
jgi:hypothetical protein